jgi:hypothetical protein
MEAMNDKDGGRRKTTEDLHEEEADDGLLPPIDQFGVLCIL